MSCTAPILHSEVPSRILYVEDNHELRDLLAAVLMTEGYDVVAVPTAEVAWDELNRRAFDLLITDYELPGANGGWLLDAAAAQGLLPAGGAIVVSGAARLAVGSTLVLRKPVDIDRLLAEVAIRLEDAAASPPRVSIVREPIAPSIQGASSGSGVRRRVLPSLPRPLVRLGLRETRGGRR